MFELHNSLLKKGIETLSFSIQSHNNFEDNNEYKNYIRAFEELDELGLLAIVKNSNIRITPLGKKVYEEIGIENYIQDLNKKEKRKSKKERFDYSVSKWKYHTFWWFFALAIFGGGYSAYDFISKYKTVGKEIKNQEKQSNKSLNSKQLILKKTDSINITPNSDE